MNDKLKELIQEFENKLGQYGYNLTALSLVSETLVNRKIQPFLKEVDLKKSIVDFEDNSSNKSLGMDTVIFSKLQEGTKDFLWLKELQQSQKSIYSTLKAATTEFRQDFFSEESYKEVGMFGTRLTDEAYQLEINDPNRVQKLQQAGINGPYTLHNINPKVIYDLFQPIRSGRTTVFSVDLSMHFGQIEDALTFYIRNESTKVFHDLHGNPIPKPSSELEFYKQNALNNLGTTHVIFNKALSLLSSEYLQRRNMDNIKLQVVFKGAGDRMRVIFEPFARNVHIDASGYNFGDLEP